MKINKYLLYLLFVPALSMTSCSDFEDTEVASPQADQDALGANFTAATSTATVNPDKGTSFTVTMNRVNTTGAATVPVKVESYSKIGDEPFCDQPTAFVFAAGESKASVTLKLNSKCKYQTTYSLKLSIGGNTKDHLYAAGTSLTTISVTRDYKWTALGQPVLLEKGWYDGGILAPVQWASDYIGANPLFRVGAPYYYASLPAASTAGSFQFFLDNTNYDFAGMLNKPGEYEATKVNTGMKEDGALLYMNVTQTKKEGTVYTFTYDLFSVKDGQNVNFKQGITAELDFDIKGIMEEE